MRKAYTHITGWGTPHLDVGATYPTREQAEDARRYLSRNYDVIEVVCHVEDFTAVHGARFMVRTDGNHELSFVVDAYESGEDWRLEHPDHARLHTRIIDSGGSE